MGLKPSRTLCCVVGSEMRFLQPQMNYIRQIREWVGDLGGGGWRVFSKNGVGASYTAADFRELRTRGLPYNLRDSADTTLIAENAERCAQSAHVWLFRCVRWA